VETATAHVNIPKSWPEAHDTDYIFTLNVRRAVNETVVPS
jgi:hypothetical protein